MNILILSQYFWPENFRINELTFELSKLKKIKFMCSLAILAILKKAYILGD